MKTFALTLAAMAVFSADVTRAALITPTSQSRTVSISATSTYFDDTPLGCTESDTAFDASPAFAPFNSSVSANALCSFPALANASQTSIVLDDRIIGVGAVDTRGHSSVYREGLPSASSSVSVGFQISETVDYSFQGQLTTESALHLLGAGGVIQLAGPNEQDVFFLSIDPLTESSATKSLVAKGTLFPGEYVLQVNAAGLVPGAGGVLDVAGETSRASFDFDFSVIPEPTSGLLLAFGLPLLVAMRRTWSVHSGGDRS